MMHLKDLEGVLDAPVAGDMLTLPPRAKLEVVPPPAIPAAPIGRTDDLALASAGEIAARVRRRELSPFEVARVFVERADAHRSLNAFITLRPETLFARGAPLETRLQASGDLGLAGVPVAVKDLMREGCPFTCGEGLPGDESEHARW
jgi:hypothetical protein